MATSMIVSTKSIQKILRYAEVECAVEAMSVPLTVALQQVNKSKNKYPDKIDKVPVQPGDLDMLRFIAAAIDRRQHTSIVDHPAGHVHSMKTGENEKRRRKEIVGKRDSQFRQLVA